MKLSRSLIAVFALAVLSMFGGRAMAGDDVVVPFIDSKTDLVFHANLTGNGTDLMGIWNFCTRMISTSDFDAAAQKQVNEMLGGAFAALSDSPAKFQKAGCKDLYIAIGLQSLPSGAGRGVGIIVPLGIGADADALGKILTSDGDEQNGMVAVVVGRALVVTAPQWADYFKTPSTEARPDLLEALKAGPDNAAIHLAVSPAAIAKLPLEFIPSGMVWEGISFSLPPAESARIVLKCKDADAATAKTAQLQQTLAKLTDDPKARDVFGEQTAVVAQGLLAKADGDKIAIDIDKPALDAVVMAAYSGKLNRKPATQPADVPPAASETGRK